ncbi:8692_t:CDS:1, partial [Acaulospora morrowiae]
DGKAKIREYLDHRMARHNEILAILEIENSQFTSDEIVAIIYANYPKSLWSSAKKSVNLHLYELEKEGRVCKISNSASEVKWALANL